MSHLREAFKKLDTNNDGVLSREELLQGYKESYGEMAEVEVDRIMAVADADQNGYLEYSEWLAASIDKESLFNE